MVARARCGGDDRDRTGDLRLAKPALFQLSYVPDVPAGTPRVYVERISVRVSPAVPREQIVAMFHEY
jgi:hypothetical protein